MSQKITNDLVESAFAKLQANVYFDNYDLVLRERIAIYKRKLNYNIDSFLEESKSAHPFENHIRKMGFTVLPKKIEQINKFPPNYYTNAAPIVGNEISRPNVHCDFPVELHLIATIWLMRYGTYIEKMVPKTSFGNRLAINRNTNEIEGRSLFKPYFKQFQNWWSLAIKETKKALKAEQSVTILNFDLKSFYHEVKFDFDKLELTLIKAYPQIENDPIHIALKEAHIAYRDLLKGIKKDITVNGNIVPLPIGLNTSHLFANFHLRSLDRFIKKECDPLYYGRYVDDVLIVIKNTLLEDDEVIKVTSKSGGNNEIVKLYLKNYFSKLFIVPENDEPIRFKIASIKNLKLNMDKLFIYQFDKEHTPNLIEKFVEEQKERGSMFRFLSDEEDETFDDFESQTFESNFDHVDLNKARFKNLEDNKYKLSTFLSKLIRRRIQRGEGYKESEIAKIRKYFKGGYLIKHYFFWEKLLTLFVVYKRRDEFASLVGDVLNEIDSIQTSKIGIKEFDVTTDDYKESLKLHLKIAVSMSLGLDMQMLRGNNKLINSLEQLLSSIEQKNARNYEAVEDYLVIRYSLFRDAGLLRGAFVYYPLFQFTKFAYAYDVDLTSPDSIFQIPEEEVKSSFEIRRVDFIPFRVKFWQVAILKYYENLLSSEKQADSKWFTDKFSSNEILNIAFDLFYKINKPTVSKNTLRDEYFQAFRTDKRSSRDKLVIPDDRSRNFYVQEVYIPNGGAVKEVYRIAMINKYVDSKDYLASLDGNPIEDKNRMEVFDRILDDVAQVKKCDLFVMPELSLPHKLFGKYVDQVARMQIGYVGGMEHLKIQNIGFNFILTALPINIGGDKDAVPVLRLKNHYAPIEEECIWDVKARGGKMSVPKPQPYRYDLFEWRGFYFASYYCYELADVFHRSIFFSQIDAIIAPVWNPDTHYYNSIVDAATRDMHNYFIIVNTSQYGFSKISRPLGHVDKEKVMVKGGTEEEYNFTLLVGDLKVKELRDFQKLSHQEQKKAKAEAKAKKTELKIKATPPDFPKENVEIREENERFYSS